MIASAVTVVLGAFLAVLVWLYEQSQATWFYAVCIIGGCLGLLALGFLAAARLADRLSADHGDPFAPRALPEDAGEWTVPMATGPSAGRRMTRDLKARGHLLPHRTSQSSRRLAVALDRNKPAGLTTNWTRRLRAAASPGRGSHRGAQPAAWGRVAAGWRAFREWQDREALTAQFPVIAGARAPEVVQASAPLRPLPPPVVKLPEPACPPAQAPGDDPDDPALDEGPLFSDWSTGQFAAVDAALVEEFEESAS